ncbi:hypothetical protein B0E44_11590 [Flavobacterium sp. A45]|nr:hypothetical protein [Flavobacterium sp. A45]OOG69998.1 hypothetical protein B0E44_11590 [Flavobacterium sp. A45]
MNIIKRVKAPTPKFFKVLRNIGVVLAAVGGSIVAAPIVLPLTVVTLGGYLAVGGSVLSAVSQLTTDSNSKPDANE